MRVLVTGSNGLLGRAVVAELNVRGHEVWQVDNGRHGIGERRILFGDLTRQADMAAAIFGAAPEAVVHLAGRRSAVYQQHTLAADLLLDNLAIDVCVFHSMVHYGIRRGVYASTVSVYPEYQDSPRYAEADANRFPADSVRFSAWGKLTAERMIEAINLQHKSQINVVRLVNTYGPHDYFGHGSLVIPSLIRRALDGESPFAVEGASNLRDFLYVADAARGIADALEKGTGDVYNLGSGMGYTIGRLARTVLRLCGRDPMDCVFQKGGQTGAERKVIDPTKAQKLLGWERKIHLEEGLRLTIEWYREHGRK